MISLKPRVARLLAVVLLCMVALEAVGLVYLKELPFSRITVLSYDTEGDLYWRPERGKPSTFTDSRGVMQAIVGPEYGVFRQYRAAVEEEVGIELAGAQSDLERAVVLRQWARGQYDFSAGSGKLRMFDYEGLLRNRRHDSGLCDAFATLFVGAAISIGLPARVVHLNTSAGTDSRGHYTAEVYLPDQQRWVVMDPLYNCYYSVEDRPLSALDLHRLARKSQAHIVKVERTTGPKGPPGLHLDNYYRYFQIVNRTDFDTYRLNLFGDKLLFLNWVGDGASVLGRREAALRVILFFIWPAVALVTAAVLIVGGRPRRSLFLLAGKKPVRPEYRE